MQEYIYIVEDDESIRELLRCTLETFSYKVMAFERAEEMLEQCEQIVPKLILLDIMLPQMNGITALKILKSSSKTKGVPVIMLTAKSSEVDKVAGLDNGADDYITKPFGILELTARIRAVLRRFEKQEQPEKLEFKDIVIDFDRREVRVNDQKIDLTLKEYELMKYLFINPQKVISREELLNEIWGYDFEGESRTLDMHIKTLRSKLNDDADNPKYIKTVRGVGYTVI